MSNQQDKKRRKFNHDSVARSGHRKGSFSPDTRKPQTSNKTLNKTKLDNKKKRKMDVEEISRSSFTPGWNDSISREVKLSLPIKTMDGRIIQVKRITEERKESDFIDKSAVKDKSTDDQGDEDSTENYKHIKQMTMSERINDIIAQRTVDQVKGIISTICINITADPQNNIIIRKNKLTQVMASIDEYPYDLKDLIEFMKQDKSPKITELAMLSLCILFKDIVPSYKIRQTNEDDDTDVKLKKETKRLKDFESNLVQLYRSYLDALKAKINRGLGSTSKVHHKQSILTLQDPAVSLGFSALRCQCELIRKIYHFNYREDLVNSIISRIASTSHQSSDVSDQIREICCDTVKYLLTNDNDFELSIEIIKNISSVLAAVKYDVPEALVETLQYAKLTVHADKSESLKKQAKKEKRQRKRHHDEVDIALLESNALKEKTTVQKNQVNCLREIAMIYFRIIKLKIGFNLFSVVLQGLGKITHLINMDMVEDLIPLLKDILRHNPPPPVHIKLLCVHCVLKTILGPGAELGVDDELFILTLNQLIIDMPSDFASWNLLFEAVEMAFLKKRETRPNLISSALRGLFTVSCHLPSAIGATGFALAHAILLRYPKIRIDMQILSNKTHYECDPEEVVEDYAMKALREVHENDHDAMDIMNDKNSASIGDGSMIVTLMRHHGDKRFSKIIDMLVVVDILPVPFQTSDAITRPEKDDVDRMEASFRVIRQPGNKQSHQKPVIKMNNKDSKSGDVDHFISLTSDKYKRGVNEVHPWQKLYNERNG